MFMGGFRLHGFPWEHGDLMGNLLSLLSKTYYTTIQENDLDIQSSCPFFNTSVVNGRTEITIEKKRQLLKLVKLVVWQWFHSMQQDVFDKYKCSGTWPSYNVGIPIE